jgi:hypothetical protein
MVAGCANSDELKARFNGRWGPDPVIQAASFGPAAQNQYLVLSYLQRNAGLIPADAVQLSQLSPAGWNEVAQWGFNIGRQDCQIYMDNLFRLAREKSRNDSMLTALGTAAAAIVTGTTTAQKPLSILAAVFGLSVALNNAIFDSYLFTQAPGLIAKKVGDLQEAFRNSVVSGDFKVTTASSAYYAIQSYYNICLPPTIEGVLLQSIADSNPTRPAAGAPGPTGANAIVSPELRQ